MIWPWNIKSVMTWHEIFLRVDKLNNVVAYDKGLCQSYMTLLRYNGVNHMAKEKYYIPISTTPMFTKHDRMIAYEKWSSSAESYDPLITSTHVVTKLDRLVPYDKSLPRKSLNKLWSRDHVRTAGLNISTRHQAMSGKKSIYVRRKLLQGRRSRLEWSLKNDYKLPTSSALAFPTLLFPFMNILIDNLFMQFFYIENRKTCLSKKILYQYLGKLLFWKHFI